jgi:two-component system sensor histidine kinase YesM
VTLVILFSYRNSVDIIRKQSIELNDKLIENGISNIDSELNSIQQVVYALFGNEDFVNTIPKSSLVDDYTAYGVFNSIGASMQEVLSAKSNIFSIIYMDNNKNLIYSTSNKTSYERSVEIDDIPVWFSDTVNQLKEDKYRYVLIPTHKHLSIKSDFSVINDMVYTYACSALDLNNGFKSLGVLMINFDLSKLSEISENVKPYDNSFTYIVSEDGTIIYDSTQISIGEHLRPDILDKIKLSNNYFSANINNTDYIVVYAESKLTKWKMLSLVPVAEYSKDINNITKYIIFLAVFATGISIIITLLFSKQFSKPIEHLSDVMNKIEDGDIDLRVDEKGSDEIGALSRNFNSLISRLKYVMKHEYELTIRQKDAELKALQAQINPHFLFNVLQSINSIAVLHNIKEISTIATSLGKIMRYSIKTSDNIVSIKEECEYIIHFLEIHKVRFGSKFKYYINIPEDLMKYSILKLTLQPIVENAVIHGFKNDGMDWILIIDASLDKDVVIFDISDNGVGMTDKNLRTVNNNILNSPTGFYTNDFASIGLKNVFYRLKINYGEDSKIDIDSEVGVGTTVRIQYPAILYKEVNEIDSNPDSGR